MHNTLEKTQQQQLKNNNKNLENHKLVPVRGPKVGDRWSTIVALLLSGRTGTRRNWTESLKGSLEV